MVAQRGGGEDGVRCVPARRLVVVVQPAASNTPSDKARHSEPADIPWGICRCQASRQSAWALIALPGGGGDGVRSVPPRCLVAVVQPGGFTTPVVRRFVLSF
jgi:hypothetical protein